MIARQPRLPAVFCLPGHHRFAESSLVKRLLLPLPPLLILLQLPAAAAEPPDFVRDIRPILSDACFNCHGPDAEARQADLRLDQRQAAIGSKVLSNGEMLRRLQSDDPELVMPPPQSIRPLNTEQRQQLSTWLQSGAEWPEDDRHWSFIPPLRPAVPQLPQSSTVRNEIDAFVQQRLQQQNLQPSPQADRASLLRRLSFDLTGLPPTVAELDAFLQDQSETAWAAAVDRLMSSPRYGEHMALGWLEAARYADTDGYQNDRLRYMWVWRDWVINAFNDNMPFDQFLIQQLAGDLLPERNFMTQVATGFQRNHRINSEGGSIPDEWIVEYVADRVETTGTIFLGLTFNCARCHDHKYDPFSQQDYYQLFAFFNNIAEAGLGPNDGNSPPFIPVPDSWPNLSPAQLAFVEPEPPKVTLQQTSVPRPQPGSPKTVMVMHEQAEQRPTYLLSRGRYDAPDTSHQLLPATPQLLSEWRPEWPANRLGLAKWLVSPDHPLTARVTVNRIWQHFFGQGLVRTADNFGSQGEYPSHPELLDWLATEFIRLNWDVRALQKLIVSSGTYQQSSLHTSAADPDNRLLSRGPRRRLSPYAIRDTALYVSGLLQEDIGGPSVRPYMPPGIWRSISNATYKQDSGAALYRRSMYTYWRRTVPPPTMMTFNAAAREVCVVQTAETTTPLQALTLLNNQTFVEASRLLAERMLKQGGSDTEQLTWAFRSITSRTPTAAELRILLQDLQECREEFAQNPREARQLLAVGEWKADPDLPPQAVAAAALAASTILNLDESITRN